MLFPLMIREGNKERVKKGKKGSEEKTLMALNGCRKGCSCLCCSRYALWMCLCVFYSVHLGIGFFESTIILSVNFKGMGILL